MKRIKTDAEPGKEVTISRAMSPEARENQLIAAAVDLAEKQLREGTASSQVICHYLKLGSTKERLEKEELVNKIDLMKAKKDALESQKRVEELYANALNAMRAYSGASGSFNNFTNEIQVEDPDLM